MSTILPGLLYRMASLEATNGPYFPGTTISNAVYELTYESMGKLVAELYQCWDQFAMPWGPERPFHFSDYDHTNGFEEFICTLVEHWCHCMGLFDHIGEFRHDRLDAFVSLFESCQGIYDIYDRMTVAIDQLNNQTPGN